MPATFFCPACWQEVSEEDPTCQACGEDLSRLDAEPFTRKLARALWCPEPLTARRAAFLLGQCRDAGAVDELVRRYDAGADPYLGSEIAVALGAIGGQGAEVALDRIARDPSVVVRAAVAGARRGP